MKPLTETFRPARLAAVRGQPKAQRALASFVKHKSSKAFLFIGKRGIGKTSSAYALAAELGVDVADVFGGFHYIKSGDTDGECVREILGACHTIPTGKGWHVVLCDECHTMSAKAAGLWLSALEPEHLPKNTVFIFATNYPEKLADEFIDRCEVVEFEHRADLLRDAAQSLVDDVWIAMLGHNHAPTLAELGITETVSNLSFRNVLTRLEPRIREAMPAEIEPTKPEPEPTNEGDNVSTAELKAVMKQNKSLAELNPHLAPVAIQAEPVIETAPEAPKADPWSPAIGDVATTELVYGREYNRAAGPIRAINASGQYQVDGFWFDRHEIEQAA